MRVPAHPGRALLGAALAAFLSVVPSSLAQQKPILDLGSGPVAPPAGQGAGAIALAGDLRKQAEDLLSRAGAGDAERTQAAARTFAAKLLTTGEQAGQDGSERALIARTLVRAMADIDLLIAGIREDDGGAQLELVRLDLEAASLALDNPGADPWRTARDALALLLQSAGSGPVAPTWPTILPATPAAPLARHLDAWAKLPGVSPAAIAALRDLDALCAAARPWPAYGLSADRTLAAIHSAAIALQMPGQWITEPARRVMGEQFSAAVLKLPREDVRDAGLAELRRLGRFGVIASRAEKLEDTPAARRSRTSLAQMMASTQPDLGAEKRLLDAYQRALDLEFARTTLPEEKDVARQLRPAWRTISQTLRDAEKKLNLTLPETVSRVDAMTDPGVLATIAAYRRALQDLELLAELNAVMATADKPGAEPQVTDRWKRVADRTLKLGQELAKSDTRDAALASLRGMGEQIQKYTRLPGEDALREEVRASKATSPGTGPAAAPATWAALTGGREAKLLAEITDRRGGWLDGWDKAGYAGSGGDVQRLEALRILMDALWDASTLVASDASGNPAMLATLNGWAGWEMTPDALRAIAGDLQAQLAEAVRLMIEGDADKSAELVLKIRPNAAAALLATRLARQIKERGDAPSPPLFQASCGGPLPGQTWMGDDIPALADICRYAEEAAAARALGARERAETLARYVNTRAEEVAARSQTRK